MKSSECLNQKLKDAARVFASIFPLELAELDGRGDFFKVDEREERIQLAYTNLRSAIHGVMRLSEAWHLQDLSIFRPHQAKVSWRILMPTFTPVDPQFFEHAIEEGYNSVILDEGDFLSIREALAWDLKVILRLRLPACLHELTPFDGVYRERLTQFFKELREKCPSFHAIYWESSYYGKEMRGHLLKHGKLRSELYLAELAELERLSPLFIAIPPGETSVSLSDFVRLEQHAGPHTWLVFSAYDGDAGGVHLGESRYWSQKKDRSIPMLSYSSEEMALPMHGPLSQFFSKPIPGAILKLSHPPKKAAFSHANFYIAAKVLFEGNDPLHSMRRWLMLHRGQAAAKSLLIDRLTVLLSKYTYLKAIERGSQPICQEELKWQIDELIPLSKGLERALEVERKKALDAPLFFNELQETLEGVLGLARAILTKQQMQIPALLRSSFS